jgi:hypothetical protein
VCNLAFNVREEKRLRMFENTMVKIVFGHKKNEVTRGEWNLHNEELQDFKSSTNIIRISKYK